MRLFIGTEEECDRRAALEVVKQIKSKPDSVLGLATGSTPIGMYRNMAQAYQDGEISYSESEPLIWMNMWGWPKTSLQLLLFHAGISIQGYRHPCRQY